MGISEVRCPRPGTLQAKRKSFYHSGNNDPNHHNGVGVFLDKEVLQPSFLFPIAASVYSWLDHLLTIISYKLMSALRTSQMKKWQNGVHRKSVKANKGQIYHYYLRGLQC